MFFGAYGGVYGEGLSTARPADMSHKSEKSRNRATDVVIVASVDNCGCIQMLGESNFLGHGVPCLLKFPARLTVQQHYRILAARQGLAARNPLQCGMITRRF